MLKIKKFKKTDLEDVLKIILKTKAAVNRDEAKWLMELSIKQNKRILKPEYYVLFDDKKIIGVSGLYQDYEDPEHVRWLDYLAITPKVQRRGYGTMLLENLEKICQKKKVKILCVFTDNQKAINFYKKHNFEIIGKIDKYYAPDSPKVWLYKKINVE